MITASMPMASMVSTVSRSDSPFFSDEEPAAKESTSADIRLAAVSKDMRVRVESSKNRVATVRPRRAGTLGLARRPTSTKESATRSTSADPLGVEVVHAEQVGGERAHRLTSSPERHAVVGDVDHLVPAGGQVLAHVVGPDGQLAVAPVDHHRQLDHLGPSVLAQGVEGGPDGPPGEQHVVDQHHGGRRSGRS